MYMRAYKQRADVNQTVCYLFDQSGFLLFNQYFSCRDKLNYAQNEAGEKKIVGRFKRYFNILDSKKALEAELNELKFVRETFHENNDSKRLDFTHFMIVFNVIWYFHLSS